MDCEDSRRLVVEYGMCVTWMSHVKIPTPWGKERTCERKAEGGVCACDYVDFLISSGCPKTYIGKKGGHSASCTLILSHVQNLFFTQL